MTTEALRAALEVLECLHEDFVCGAAHHAAKDRHGALAPCPINERRLKAIELIRAALAQPSTEPVAWIQPDHLQKARVAPFMCRVEPTKRCADFVPIYTTPPSTERKPLTDEQIAAIGKRMLGVQFGNTDVDFARAIERAVKGQR